MISRARAIWSRVRAFVSRTRLDRQFDEELATHLELLVDDGRRRGLSEQDARREALLRLGRPESLRDQHRDARGLPLVDALMQDAKYAVRTLWQAPFFTIVVTLSLALGIGANTALFSLVDSLLLRSLPVRDPAQLVQVQVYPGKPGGGFKKAFGSFLPPAFDEVRARRQMFATAVGFQRLDRPTVAVDGAIEPGREVEEISSDYFAELGVGLVGGRWPQPSDVNVAVISSRWSRTRFGGDTTAAGRSVSVEGKLYEIIGVAPPRFHGFMIDSSADLWIVTGDQRISSGPAARALRMIARLQPGVTVAQAQDAMAPFFQEYLQRYADFPADEPLEVEMVAAGKGVSTLRTQYSRALLALMGLVTLVLLTTSTNVGTLLMLRNAARRRELTIRAALGAGRSRLILQYLVESALLAIIGCAAGLWLADWGVSLVLGMLPLQSIPDGLAFHLDARILAFALAVAAGSVLLFGLAPAWRATDVDATGALRSSQGASAPARSRRLGRLLVGCQVGLSVLLLVGAGLFVQTLRNLSQLDLGYSADRLLQVSVDTRFAGYKSQQVEAVFRLMLERVGDLTGVQSATGVRNSLMRRGFTSMAVRLPGFEPPGNEVWDGAQVGPAFFETMGIRAVRGRTFTAEDFGPNRVSYVVNEAWVRRYFPNDDPLVKAPNIVGIVPNVRLFDMRSDVRPMMYETTKAGMDRLNALEVRTSVDAATVVPAIRQAIQAINPRLFVGIRTFQDEIEQDIARERMVAAISAFFSGLGLLLASVGIFGVASYTVTQRTKELGIRRALGANSWSVIREALRETSVVFAFGLVAGTAVAFVLVRYTASLISDLLFGLTATDARNIGLAVLVMLVVAMVACTLPASRATRIDPLRTIREE